MAVHFKLVILFLDLHVLGLFLVLVVDVIRSGMTNQIITVIVFVMSSNLTFLVVVVDTDSFGLNVELCFLDLVVGGQILVQLKLLGHFVDQYFSVVVVLSQAQRLWVELSIWRESDTAIDELVRPILVLLDNLVLFVKELLSENEAILLAMVIEVQFSVATILSDHLLPMIVLERALVVLDQFEFVGESSSDN